jgi:hypothetical protein
VQNLRNARRALRNATTRANNWMALNQPAKARRALERGMITANRWLASPTTNN